MNRRAASVFAVLLVMCTQIAAAAQWDPYPWRNMPRKADDTIDMQAPPPATEALHVVERFTRPTIGRVDIDVTTDDPKAYTKPWNVKLVWRLVPDTDLTESICEERQQGSAANSGDGLTGGAETPRWMTFSPPPGVRRTPLHTVTRARNMDRARPGARC